MRKSLCALTLAALALAGCEGGGFNRTVAGAGLGALAGAGIGSLAGGNDTRNMLIGAGIGALAGGAVGAYMDQQQAVLTQQLQGTGAMVRRNGDTLLVDLPSNITFAFDSAELQPRFYSTLSQIANTLKQYPQTVIEVGGHTDNVGSAAYNQRLSEDRAMAVGQYLVAQGVQPERLTVRGFGFTHPAASNQTEDGRQQNRRVEIEIRPYTG